MYIYAQKLPVEVFHPCTVKNHGGIVVISGADSERHCILLVRVTKMYSDGHYLLQISLPFHHVFLVYMTWVRAAHARCMT